MSKFGYRLSLFGFMLLLFTIFPVSQTNHDPHTIAQSAGRSGKVDINPSYVMIAGRRIALVDRRVETSFATDYYISPNGSDLNSGNESAKPWRTFKFAIPKLQPGDTLILLDGIYQKDTTGLPYINCADAKFANNGTSSAAITIKAQNERLAFLKSDGAEYALLMTNCSYWNVIGLRGASADLSEADGGQLKSVFKINESNDVTLKRLLSTHSNRYFNDHTYEISYSSRVLIEDSEAYYFHRHGFDIWQSKLVIIRRCYANSRDYADRAGGYESIYPDGGDEGFALYYTSDSIIENSISHGNNLGFEIHGGPNFFGEPGGHNNQILGSMYLGGQYGAKIDTRKVDGIIWPTENNLIKDFLVLNTSKQGIILDSTKGAQIENATIYNTGDDGIQVKESDPNDMWCDDIPGGCSFVVTNSVVFNSAGYGITVRHDDGNWLVEYSNVVASEFEDYHSTSQSTEDIADNIGYIRNSTSITPTGLGLKGENTIIYIPPNSNLKGRGKNGEDIGANILFRYENGVLTQQPLWAPATGAFPCGDIVSEVNDITGSSCFDVHTDLNVNAQTLPSGYRPPTLLYLPFVLKENAH